MCEVPNSMNIIEDPGPPRDSESKLNDRVMVPLLLADELLEECWNATSKLESQFLRNEDIPRAYAEIIDKSFAALKKLQAARMAA